MCDAGGAGRRQVPTKCSGVPDCILRPANQCTAASSDLPDVTSEMQVWVAYMTITVCETGGGWAAPGAHQVQRRAGQYPQPGQPVVGQGRLRRHAGPPGRPLRGGLFCCPSPISACSNPLPATACRPIGTALEVTISTSSLGQYLFAPACLPKTLCHLFDCFLLCPRRQTSASTPTAAALLRRSWLPASWPLAPRPRAPPTAPPRPPHGGQALWVIGWSYLRVVNGTA